MLIHKLISKYNYSVGTTSRIKYIVIHYTGSSADANSQVKYFAGGNKGASAHYFVGFKGDVWQSVEDANIAWHCGSKKYRHPECRNQNSIGIELCAKTNHDPNKADENWYFEDSTVNSAIELTKELMKKYNVPANHVIRHYDVTGKICPAPFVLNKGKHTWEEFKAAIGDTVMSNSKTVKTFLDDNAAKIWRFLKSKGLSDFASAGVMGNLYAESGLRPNNLQNTFEKKLNYSDDEYTKAVDSGKYSKDKFVKDKAGYGLAQWTYWSRKKALYEFAKSEGVSISDLDMQLKFFWKEVSPNKSLMDRLNKAASIRDASDAMLHLYERPADQSAAVSKKRAEYGETFYKLYSQIKEVKTDESFKVRVDIDNLNIRTGPGMECDRTGMFTGKGVFTIVETKGDWGRLKSPVGWINLKFAERIWE